MKSSLYMLVTAMLAGLLLVGCGNTAEGAKEDATKNTKMAGEGARQAGEKAGDAMKVAGEKVGGAMKEAGDKIGEAADKAPGAAKEAGAKLAAASLTTQIKAALIANPITNSPDVVIDVDSTPETVTLKGHVAKQEQKDEAEQISKEILKKAKATQAFKNDLEVTKK